MIESLDVKDLMAVWGGLLSTGLAGIKVFEWWRDRDRVDISFGSSTSVEHGNQIQIRNKIKIKSKRMSKQMIGCH
jgi:hypothetical protein